MTAPKPLTDYLDPRPTWWTAQVQDYTREPAATFLREAVHISDAMNQCRRRFQRKASKALNKDSQDSIYRLGGASLAAIMGHLETFQRALFAGIVEASRLLPTLSVEKVCKKLEQDSHLSITLDLALAYRGRPVPIGQLLADSLASWHNPRVVNRHFQALVEYQFFSTDSIAMLEVLWQLRHSVVHTGGWLTQADAQKQAPLYSHANRPILLSEKFIEAVVRRLHPVVKASTNGLETAFRKKLPGACASPDEAFLKALFTVKSPRSVWL